MLHSIYKSCKNHNSSSLGIVNSTSLLWSIDQKTFTTCTAWASAVLFKSVPTSFSKLFMSRRQPVAQSGVVTLSAAAVHHVGAHGAHDGWFVQLTGMGSAVTPTTNYGPKSMSLTQFLNWKKHIIALSLQNCHGYLSDYTLLHSNYRYNW